MTVVRFKCPMGVTSSWRIVGLYYLSLFVIDTIFGWFQLCMFISLWSSSICKCQLLYCLIMSSLIYMYVFKICIVLYLYVNCMFNVVRITVLSVYGQDLFEKNKRSVIPTAVSFLVYRGRYNVPRCNSALSKKLLLFNFPIIWNNWNRTLSTCKSRSQTKKILKSHILATYSASIKCNNPYCRQCSHV